MIKRKFSALVPFFALLFAAFVLSGCDPDAPDGPDEPPVDSDPQVTLISPASGYALARVGETVSITFELHDNELLTNWSATERWISVSGVQVLPETAIQGQSAVLATTNLERTISYTVPNSVQVYTTIEITAYARDNKGKEASAKFRINVIPEQDSTTAYELQSYTDNVFQSITTGDDYNFDIINRIAGSDLEIASPNRYLRESSIPPSISYVFTSPITGGADSVLVTTNTNLFNFDDCTYETIYQAFVTSNRIGKQTDPMSPGDVAILKLPNNPHFAVFLIKSTVNGVITFDYKYSYQ